MLDLEQKILIAKDTITRCLNEGISHFYACDHVNIFETAEQCQIYAVNTRSRVDIAIHGLNVWFFFFDKNKELGGFRI